MKIDFRKIELHDIEGNTVVTDISKQLGESMYGKVSHVGVAIAAQDMYRTGEAEINAEIAPQIKEHIQKNFIALVQIALNPILDEIAAGKHE